MDFVLIHAFLWIFFCCPIYAKSPLNIETRSYVYDPESGDFIYHDALISWEDMTLEGTEIRLDPEQNTAIAEGYVRFKKEKILIVMDRLEVDLKTRTGVFYNAIMYDSENRAYVNAKKIRWEGGNHFVLNECSFTTCNPKKPFWEISGNQMDYRYENFGSSEHTILKVKGFPVFYFPFLVWPTTTNRKSGFLAPSIRQDTSNIKKFDLGYRVGIPFFWALDPEHDLTFQYEWVEKRGYGLNAEYYYAFKEGMFGQLQYRKYFERDPHDPEKEAGSLDASSISENDLRPERYKLVYNHTNDLMKKAG